MLDGSDVQLCMQFMVSLIHCSPHSGHVMMLDDLFLFCYSPHIGLQDENDVLHAILPAVVRLLLLACFIMLQYNFRLYLMGT